MREINEVVPGVRLNQRMRLLNAYSSFKGNRRYSYDWEPSGMLTDEIAARIAGLGHTGYWKRCSELRRDGLIKPVVNKHGKLLTRRSKSGVQVMLCKITGDGIKALRETIQDAEEKNLSVKQQQARRRAAIRNGL